MTTEAFSKHGLQRLREDLASYVRDGDRPGFVMLVSRYGDTRVDAVGFHEASARTPMRRDTIFRIASTTKPMTCAVTMRLIEEGKLSLDDPIERFIPELANRRVLTRLDGPLHETVPAHRPIVLRDLLTMTMGLGAIMSPDDYPIQTALMREGVFTPFLMPKASSADEWLATLAQFPLMDQPGEVWRYDTSLTLLGALIERVTGQDLGDVFEERLFGPLGMKDTAFIVPPEKISKLPTAYQRSRETGALHVWDPAGEQSFFAKRHGFAGAHGGLVSTVDDYLAFARMMLDGGRHGRHRVLSAGSVEQMMTDHISTDVKLRSPFVPGFWDSRGWGFGGSIMKTHEPDRPRGFGWDGGYGTVAYWDAESGVIAILFSQKLVDSPAYDAIFKTFFNGAYAAAQL